MHGKRGELTEDVRGLAGRAGDDLVLAPDELVEVLLALHARILVDRHTTSVLSAAMERWTTPTLEGRLVRLEPLAQRHGDDLWEASQDAAVWSWMPIAQPLDREAWGAWMDAALDRVEAGLDLVFATVRVSDGLAVGSTRYLALRPEHRSLEIGWTWLAASEWGRGSNAEAKLLQLGHAFDRLGCRRVEFKTDARNERSRRALEAIPATFEGIHRRHMLVRDGISRDSAWYSVVADEWPDVRAALETRLARY